MMAVNRRRFFQLTGATALGEVPGLAAAQSPSSPRPTTDRPITAPPEKAV